MSSMPRHFLILGLVTCLSACTGLEGLMKSDTDPLASAAKPAVEVVKPEPVDPTVLAYQKRIKQTSRLAHAVCIARTNHPYFSHTPCLPNTITEKELRQRQLPSKLELQAAKRVFSALNNMNEQLRTWMLNSGNAEFMKRAQTSASLFVPQASALQNEFLKGKMTWGEFNRRRLALHTQLTGASDGTDDSN